MDNSIKKLYDIDLCGHMMIKHFFDGALGPVMLDDDIVNEIDDEPLDLENFV